MRTPEQIQKIKHNQSSPVQLLNAISNNEVLSLIDYYDTDLIIQKNTGPKVQYIKEGTGVIDNILCLLRKQFGNFEVRTAHYFDVNAPHVIHIDDDFDYPNSYKAFTIPLLTEGANCDLAKLIMFDQYYYGGPAKFIRNGPANKTEFYNKNLYMYNEVEGISDKGIPEQALSMLGHLQPQWLEGLSVNSWFPWTIGSVIAFDSLQLHCASNFKEHNITRKLGISIFTTLTKD